MEYRITKECGLGWSDEPASRKASAWGVSESQRQLAQKVAPGDILLHFIDSAHAWAGYSTVTGTLQENRRDSDADWLAALPYMIPIEPGKSLKVSQCECTVAIPHLSHTNFHRQRVFSIIQSNDAKRIVEAIDAAASEEPDPSPEFLRRWEIGAESYYKAIVKELVRGNCLLCGESAESWVQRIERTGITIPANEIERIQESFLDAAHIVAHADKGPMTPDNLRAICPNCHRIVDRLRNKDRREELLRTKMVIKPIAASEG